MKQRPTVSCRIDNLAKQTYIINSNIQAEGRCKHYGKL